jgi:hypothetical protein
MERVKPFHPEALEKGIETPIIPEPFVFAASPFSVPHLLDNRYRQVYRLTKC